MSKNDEIIDIIDTKNHMNKHDDILVYIHIFNDSDDVISKKNKIYKNMLAKTCINNLFHLYFIIKNLHKLMKG